jgi:thioesterase domain-containing protein
MSETLMKLEQAHSQAHKAYKPKPYSGFITVFRASESPPGFHVDPQLGWDSLAKGGLKIYRVPGHHTSIMSSQILAEQLRLCLEKSQANSGGKIAPTIK